MAATSGTGDLACVHCGTSHPSTEPCHHDDATMPATAAHADPDPETVRVHLVGGGTDAPAAAASAAPASPATVHVHVSATPGGGAAPAAASATCAPKAWVGLTKAAMIALAIAHCGNALFRVGDAHSRVADSVSHLGDSLRKGLASILRWPGASKVPGATSLRKQLGI